MFCSNCGNQIPEGAAFCNSCGNAVNANAPAVEQVAAASQAPVAEPVAVPVAEPATETQPTFTSVPTYGASAAQSTPTFNAQPTESPSGTSVMIKGIIALACAVSFYLSIAGIIFGCLAKSGAKQFMNANGGQLFGKAKVGRILGKIGFIVGIVMSVLFVIWLIAMIVASIALR